MFVIAGSSGNTGSVVAQTLLESGAKVRVLARDERKLTQLAQRGAELAPLDLGDTPALTRALRGARGAYLLLPPNPSSQQLLADNSLLLAKLAEAVRASRVEHVVMLSSVAAQHAAGTGPIRALHEAERVLAAAAPHVTFVRAAYFMENLASSLGAIDQGLFPTFLRPELAIPMVATRDIGTTAADALLRGPAGHEVIELEGPQRYSPYEVARELSNLIGRPLQVQFGPEQAIVPTLTSFGFTPDLAELYREMICGINEQHVTFAGGTARHVRGVTPVSEVLQQLLRGRATATAAA